MTNQTSYFSSEEPTPQPSPIGPNQFRFVGDQGVGAIPSLPPSQTVQRGGVTSIQFGLSDEPMGDDYAQPTSLPYRVGNGGGRINFGDPNSFQSGGTVRVSVGGPPEATGGSVMATVRSSWGETRGPHNASPDDLVTYQGMDITVAVAEQLGVLRRNSFGLLEDAQASGGSSPTGDAQQRLDQRDAQAQADHDAVEAFSPAVEAGISAVIETVDPGTQVDILSQLASKGEVSSGAIERLASQAGIQPHEAARFVDGVAKEFEAQAKTTLAKAGVDDFDHFSEWVSQHHASELEAAIMAHGMNRNTRGYLPLAQAYVEAMDDHSPDAILSAEFGSGIRAFRADGGEIVLSVPGQGTYGWKAAVRAGLVKVSSR